MSYYFKYYCKDYENIENYEKALADNFKGWHCHHRLETHNSDGERRPVDITQKELMALNMYCNRPAEELIFLTTREHNAFKKGKPGPNKGKCFSEEIKNKMRESHKGKPSPNKGKHHSEETKKTIAESQKGRHWFNNGRINKRAKECPPGFVPGILR